MSRSNTVTSISMPHILHACCTPCPLYSYLHERIVINFQSMSSASVEINVFDHTPHFRFASALKTMVTVSTLARTSFVVDYCLYSARQNMEPLRDVVVLALVFPR